MGGVGFLEIGARGVEGGECVLDVGRVLLVVCAGHDLGEFVEEVGRPAFVLLSLIIKAVKADDGVA